MRAPFQASPDDIDLIAVGDAVKAAVGKLLLATAIAGLAALVVSSQLTPKFASQTQIEIISKNPLDQRRDLSTPEMVSVRMDKEAVGTHVRALQSSDLILQAARELDLARRPEFNSALVQPGAIGSVLRFVGLTGPRAGESDEDRVLRAFTDDLRVYQIKETRGIIVEVRSADAKLAAAAANKVAELYRDDLALRTVHEVRDARAKLGPQIARLAEEVAQAEADVTRFRGEANLFDAGRENTGLTAQQLAELTAEQTKAATARAEADARAKAARETVQRNGGESLPDVQKSALVPRLIEQRVRVERQIAELSATLLPAHPRMKQLSAELAGLNGQIRTEVGKIVDGLDREAKVAALREEGIAHRIDEAKRRVVGGAGSDVKLRALESIAKSKRAELERLQAQLESARTTTDAQAVPIEVQIISRARPSSEKAWPRTGMISLLAMMAVLLLGLAWVVVRELLAAARSGAALRSGTLVSEREMFSAKPYRPTDAAPPVPATTTTARSLAAVARQLVARAGSKTGFRTIVASQNAGSSTAQVAVEIARHVSRAGRQVVVLDWSVGSVPELSSRPKLGLSDVLSGRATFEDVIERLPGSQAHHIHAGLSAAAEASATDPDRVNMLLDALDEAYEHVLIGGAYDTLRSLFTTVEGRIDAGVIAAPFDVAVESGGFLGFTVRDLDLIRFDVKATVDTEQQVLHMPSGGLI
jgi:uncharacterized protein involved in exopolysaccharide biosynthesis